MPQTARWWARSRRGDTSITTAPATRGHEPYVREEVLEGHFGELLGRMSFDDEVMEWVREALHQSHADQKREHQAAIGRLKAEYDRLEKRINAMYVDKLDGHVDAAFFERMSREWRVEQGRCLSEIGRHEGAEQSYFEQAVWLLELAQNARRLFEKQEPREKRRLLQVSNCTWREGLLAAELRKPFDFLTKTAFTAALVPAQDEPKAAKSEIWWARQDSNLRQHRYERRVLTS